MPGKLMPSDRELKSRLTQRPAAASEGNSAARAWRTRALASSVRSVASATEGASPAARRTVSAKDNRTGPWPAAGEKVVPDATIKMANTARIIRFLVGLLRDTAKEDVDVLVEVGHAVEVLTRAQRERVAPVRRVQQWSDGQPPRGTHVDRPELAALDPTLEHAADQPLPAAHHLLVLKARQLGKVRRLRHHELGEPRSRRPTEEPPKIPDDLRQQLARAAREGLGQRLPLRDRGDDRFADDRLQQRLLAVEVEVHGALRDAGAACPLFAGGGREAMVGEHLQGGGHDLSGPRLLAALPPRLRPTLRSAEHLHPGILRQLLTARELRKEAFRR